MYFRCLKNGKQNMEMYMGKFESCLILLSSCSDDYFLLTHSHTMTPFDAPGKQTF